MALLCCNMFGMPGLQVLKSCEGHPLLPLYFVVTSGYRSVHRVAPPLLFSFSYCSGWYRAHLNPGDSESNDSLPP